MTPTTIEGDRSLVAAQNPDGGWGAGRGGVSSTEATSLALLAFPPHEPNNASVQRGLAWLRPRQRADGAWPPSDQVPLASWTTPLAVLALNRSESDRQQAVRGARWLVAQEGRGYSWFTKLFFRVFPDREVIELDADLKGWPWTLDTFSWVEPTAYALIALKTMRRHLPEAPTAARIHEGERMLFDRMCAGGGWNYGNSRVLEEELWPYPDTTALALIALRDVPLREETRLSLAALHEMIERNDSGLALSLAILCFRLYGEKVSALRARLEENLSTIESFGETRSIALSTLALDDSRLPFSFQGKDAP
ncbi:hypothetical protein BH18GEM1_BH18GEM1_12670 [soil metagenome]